MGLPTSPLALQSVLRGYFKVQHMCSYLKQAVSGGGSDCPVAAVFLSNHSVACCAMWPVLQSRQEGMMCQQLLETSLPWRQLRRLGDKYRPPNKRQAIDGKYLSRRGGWKPSHKSTGVRGGSSSNHGCPSIRRGWAGWKWSCPDPCPHEIHQQYQSLHRFSMGSSTHRGVSLHPLHPVKSFMPLSRAIQRRFCTVLVARLLGTHHLYLPPHLLQQLLDEYHLVARRHRMVISRWTGI